MSRRDIALLWNAWLAALPAGSKRRITRARERAHSSTCEKSKPNRPKYQQYFGIGGSTAILPVRQPGVPPGHFSPQARCPPAAQPVWLCHVPLQGGEANDCRKYSIVFLIPSSNSTRGSQARISFARVMSGWRTFGSSTGNGL